MERFQMCFVTNEISQEAGQIVFFLLFVEKKACIFIKNLAYPRTPICLEWAEVKFLLLARVRLVSFERVHFHHLVR